MALADKPLLNGKAPHLMCTKEDIAEIVFLPGDPGRVKIFGELFDNFQIIASNREYTVATGYYNGVKMSICSTGIGGPSTEIAVVELIELGAKCLIRVGGCGVLKKEINCGDLVINTAAIRKGGSSIFYAPIEYPAVASYEVTTALVDAAKANNMNAHCGLAASIGSFFAGQGREAVGISFNDYDVCDYYKKLNVINMEMECETIMTLGSLFDIYTGSICAVHANRETNEWLEDYQPVQMKMCKTALDAGLLINQRLLNEKKTNS